MEENRAHGPLATVEEWLELDEDDTRELVDGRLEEGEVPTSVHELGISCLIHTLRVWLGQHGFVFGSGLKLVLAVRTGRMPDLVVVLPGHKPPPPRGPLREPPDIVVEFVSPSPRDERRDRVQKMAEYARFGVPYYWIVDPALRTFEIFARSSAGYTQVAAATDSSIDPVPGCDGLELDVSALWADLERLGSE